jgi:hypothetical protein
MLMMMTPARWPLYSAINRWVGCSGIVTLYSDRRNRQSGQLYFWR